MDKWSVGECKEGSMLVFGGSVARGFKETLKEIQIVSYNFYYNYGALQ